MARATIADVARDAGVNKATASRALRGLPGVHATTRARVLDVAQRLDYAASPVATALATGRSHVIGIIVPSIRSWFFATVAAGASSALRPAGYRVELITLDVESEHEGDEAMAVQLARLGAGRDALLLAGRALGESTSGDVPALLTAPGSAGIESVTGLAVDHRRGMQLATEHLVGLGHRRIAVVDGRRTDRPDGRRWQRRTEGVETTLRAVGHDLDPRLVVFPGECDAEAGVRAMTQLLTVTEELPSAARPTAVVCHTDELAFGALATLRRAGWRVPADLSVVGFDNHPMAHLWGLTTVTQHPYSQGVVAGLALLRALEPNAGPPPAADRVQLGTTVELIIGETTCAADLP